MKMAVTNITPLVITITDQDIRDLRTGSKNWKICDDEKYIEFMIKTFNEIEEDQTFKRINNKLEIIEE